VNRIKRLAGGDWGAQPSRLLFGASRAEHFSTLNHVRVCRETRQTAPEPGALPQNISSAQTKSRFLRTATICRRPPAERHILTIFPPDGAFDFNFDFYKYTSPDGLPL
jgi:hypothetical protein